MKHSQKLITNFFKSKRKKQQFITDYFKPKLWTETNAHEKLSTYKPRSDYKKSRIYLQNHRHMYDAASTQGGYFFCASSNFCEYHVHTTIDKVVNANGQDAFVPKGTCVATAIVDSDSSLEHISVEALFRRQGIGKKLIRFINKHDSQFHVFTGIEHNSRYRLTEDGAALVHACQRAGIIQYDQIIEATVPQSPSSSSRYL